MRYRKNPLNNSTLKSNNNKYNVKEKTLMSIKKIKILKESKKQTKETMLMEEREIILNNNDNSNLKLIFFCTFLNKIYLQVYFKIFLLN